MTRPAIMIAAVLGALYAAPAAADSRSDYAFKACHTAVNGVWMRNAWAAPYTCESYHLYYYDMMLRAQASDPQRRARADKACADQAALGFGTASYEQYSRRYDAALIACRAR